MNFCPCRKQKIYVVSLIPYTWLLHYRKQILCICHFNPIQSKPDSRPTPPYCCFIAIFMHQSIPLWSLSLKHPVQRQRDRKSCSGLSSLTWLRISPVECLCHFSPTLKKLMFSIKNLQNVAFHVDVGHLTFHLTCFQLPAASLGCSRKVLQPRLAADG